MALNETYQRQGFLINREALLPHDVVAAAGEGMAAIRRGEYDTGRAPGASMWKPGDSENTLCKIEMPQLANKSVLELISHCAIGQFAAGATGARRVQVWWVQLLHKPPTLVESGIRTSGMAAATGGTNIGWHQDRSYWNAWAPQSELFTVWVALSDVTAQSGPMRFVSGSHRWGLQDGNVEATSEFFAQNLDALKANIRVPAGSQWEEAAATLPPGGFTLHHDLLWHGSGPNHTSVPRRSFAIHLRTDRSRPVDDQRTGLTRYIDDPSACPWIYP